MTVVRRPHRRGHVHRGIIARAHRRRETLAVVLLRRLADGKPLPSCKELARALGVCPQTAWTDRCWVLAKWEAK